ncbi:hypothetical protein PSA5_16135 [Pseudomonas syringae pv. actinidiae]|nr:hypothetical protein PSA5_16135 [Pseudomonas syringae pv. actinidiae]
MQFGCIAFTDKGETEEFKGFAVDIEVGTRGAQRQADTLVILADGVDLGFLLGARVLLLAGYGLLIA